MGGGSKTTSVTVPKWLEDAAKSNIARAGDVSRIGYTPYYGPDVAAMTPSQIASMQGANQMASAFGMPTADPMAGMPTAGNYGGMSAYSSGSLYDAALAELERRQPGTYAALRAPFLDPMTGARPANAYAYNALTGARSASAAAPVSAAVTREYGGGRDSGSMPSAQPARSGTGSFGLPDPMSGRISSVGPIGREGGGGLGGRK